MMIGVSIVANVRLQDPDGRRIRIYTRETHGGNEATSSSEYWLNEP